MGMKRPTLKDSTTLNSSARIHLRTKARITGDSRLAPADKSGMRKLLRNSLRFFATDGRNSRSRLVFGGRDSSRCVCCSNTPLAGWVAQLYCQHARVVLELCT
eukprot:IDg2962t1